MIELFVNYAKSHSLLDKAEKNLTQLDPNLGHLIKCNFLVDASSLTKLVPASAEGKVRIPLESAINEYLNTFRQFILVETLVDNKTTKASIIRLTEEPLITLTAARAFNKKVTSIAGAEKLQLDLDELLKYFKTKLAASGTVHDSKIGIGKEVMIQGKHLDAIKKAFVEELGLPEKQVKLIDKIGDTKKKGKKKKH